MTTPQMPKPIITPLDRPYWEYLRKHEFRLQQCSACKTFRYPAAPICAECYATTFEWSLCSGRGRVFSWVVFHKSYFPALDAKIPYNVAMVELDEGLMFISNIVEIANEDIAKGLPVQVVFDDTVYDDLTIPRFRRIA